METGLYIDKEEEESAFCARVRRYFKELDHHRMRDRS
jgi:hypothetical protein